LKKIIKKNFIATAQFVAFMVVFAVCLVTRHEAFAAYSPITNPNGHWDTATTDWYSSATGSVKDPYIIATADDLAGLAKLVDGGNTFVYKYFALVNDIDLDGREWEPIGWFMEYDENHFIGFNGTFDGRGHTISGLKITALDDHDPGVFAHIGTNGTVKNLRITDAHIKISGGNIGSVGAAGLVSFHDGLIENCVVDGYFYAKQSRTFAGPVACLVGGGRIRNVVTSGTVESYAGISYSGGIVGYITGTGTVENCVATNSSLIADMDAAGIVGGNLGNGPLYNNVSTVDSVTAALPAGITSLGAPGLNNFWLWVKDSQPEYTNTYGGGGSTVGRITNPDLLPAVAALPLTETSVLVGETTSVSTTLYPIGGKTDGLVFEWKSLSASTATVSGSGLSATVTGIKAGLANIQLVISNSAWEGTGKITLTCPVTVIAPAPPSRPQGFSVTPGDGQVALSWTAPENDGGNPITGYKVSSNGGANWIDAESETSHVFTGLANGTLYSFQVRAINEIGPGEAASITATPSAEKTAPTKPMEVSAKPGDEKVTLSWTVPESNGGDPITGYDVSSNGGTNWIEAESETSHVFTGLTNGTSYSFKVRAVNSIGNGEPESITETPRTTATAPRNFKATPGDGEVSLSWSAPENNGGASITGYKVSYGDSEWIDAENVASHKVTGLKNGKRYTFSVCATNIAGDGIAATITAAPTDPNTPAEDEDVENPVDPDDEDDETDSNGGDETTSGDETLPGSSDSGFSMDVSDTVSVETAKEEAVEQLISTAGLPGGSLVPDDNGNLVYNITEATIIAQETWIDGTVETVTPLPVKRAVVKARGGIAALEFPVKGSALYAVRPEDVKVMKIKRGGTGDAFTLATPSTGYADRTFALSKGGRLVTGAISTNDNYTLILFVKDGGDFDLDPTPERVIDPAAIVKTKTRSSASEQTEDDEPSESGGGCNAAWPAIMLVAVVPVLITKKR
jgi:uncharacterized cupin superfamily protein